MIGLRPSQASDQDTSDGHKPLLTVSSEDTNGWSGGSGGKGGTRGKGGGASGGGGSGGDLGGSGGARGATAGATDAGTQAWRVDSRDRSGAR